MNKTLQITLETVSVVLVMLAILATGIVLLTFAITVAIAAVIIGVIQDIQRKSKESP